MTSCYLNEASGVLIRNMLIIFYALLMLGVGRKYIKNITVEEIYISFFIVYAKMVFSDFLWAACFPGSTDDFKFVTTSFTVGQNVTLTCPRQTSPLHQETLYWIRLVSGTWPKFLGGTYNFDDKFDDVIQIPHITAKQGDETFILHFNGAKLNDTGLYYCFKIKQLDMTFLYGTFLKIKGK